MHGPLNVRLVKIMSQITQRGKMNSLEILLHHISTCVNRELHSSRPDKLVKKYKHNRTKHILL